MEEVDIEDLKKQRSTSKTKVTTSGSRLTKAVAGNLAPSLLTQFHTELVVSYLDFSTVDEKYKSKIDSDDSFATEYEVIIQVF